jgi:hypothetical protein
MRRYASYRGLARGLSFGSYAPGRGAGGPLGESTESLQAPYGYDQPPYGTPQPAYGQQQQASYGTAPQSAHGQQQQQQLQGPYQTGGSMSGHQGASRGATASSAVSPGTPSPRGTPLYSAATSSAVHPQPQLYGGQGQLSYEAVRPLPPGAQRPQPSGPSAFSSVVAAAVAAAAADEDADPLFLGGPGASPPLQPGTPDQATEERFVPRPDK